MKKLLVIIIFNLAIFGTGMSQWQQANGPNGGCIMTMEVDPNTNYIFAGTFGGGIFLSTDNGNSWTSKSTGITNSGLFIKDIAISGSNIFAGTYSDGIFLSINNGNTWTAVNNGLINKRVNSLAIYGASVFAGTGDGMFLSTDNGNTWTEVSNGLTSRYIQSIITVGTNIFVGTNDGVFRSTDNGGNWVAANEGIAGIGIFCLAVSGSNIFAGTLGNGIYLSSDSGISWSEINAGLTGNSILTLFTNGSNIYAGLDQGLFLLNSIGNSWIPINNGLSGHGLNVRAVRTSGSNLIVGTVSGVYVSINNGSFWSASNLGLSNTGVQSLAVNATKILSGTWDGGAFISDNNGINWNSVNSGLSSKANWGWDLNTFTINGGNIFAGTNAGIFFSNNNGNSWLGINNGLTGYGLSVSTIGISGTYIFAGTWGGGIYLSSDNGNSWTTTNSGLPAGFLVVRSIVIDGSNIYAGTDAHGVFLSNNNGSSWAPVNNGLSGNGLRVSSLAINGGFIYAGTGDGIYLSSDNGSSWTRIETGFPDSWIESLVIYGNDILSRTENQDVFLSRDRGITWSDTHFSEIPNCSNGTGPTSVFTYPIGINGSYIFSGTSGNGVWKRSLSDFKILSVSTTSLTIAAPINSTKTFDITSNTSWTVSSNQTWLSTSSTTGTGNTTITLTAQANPTSSPRTATISISGTGVSTQTISVTQDGSPSNCGTVTDVDGNTYNTVTIGTQCWFKENLKTTRYRDGSNIPQVTDNTAWSNLTTPGFSWYNNDEATYKNTYGGLYNWYTANTYNLCPTGWHTPNDNDWTILVDYLGGEPTAGGKLKEAGTTHWDSPNTGATNESGFTSLPFGARQSGGAFSAAGPSSVWWSSSEYNSLSGWARSMYYANSAVTRFGGNKTNGMYVRCVQGEGVTLPVIAAAPVTSITNTSAISGGNISSDGGTAILARGVCWSISANPTMTDSKTTDGTGTGSFSSSITGLIPFTTYHVRAYATNSIGTAYGNEVIFNTLTGNCGTLTDIDGNIYNSVSIGTQCWMKENLKTTRYSNGTAISLVNTTNTWDALTITSKAYSWYNDDINNKNIYGALYSWTAAMNGADTTTANPSGVQGVCPTGWHLPSWNEWSMMIKYIDPAFNMVGSSIAGGPMKESGTTHWNSPNTGATNESGFTALPGGGRGGDGVFLLLGSNGVWWSTTQYGSVGYARTVSVDNNSTGTQMFSTPWDCGLNVRCVRNEVQSLASISTSAISDIASNTASGGGNVTSDGGATVTARGVCWSASANPAISDNKTTDGTGTGVYSSTITGLTPSTTYHVRAYATNSVGTAYSNDISFTTLSVPSVATLNGSGDACFGNTSSIRSVITGGVPPYIINYKRNGVAQIPINGYISGSDFLLGILPAGTYTYAITSITDSGGNNIPVGGLPLPYSIIINPIPDATASVLNKPLLCSDSLLKITLYSTVNNTIFNYAVASDPSGYPVESNGSITDSDGDGKEVLTRYLPNNFLNTPATVTYTITPFASGCSGTPINREVKIEPRVLIPPYPIDTVCNNMLSMINVNTSTIGVNGIKYNWTVSTPTGVCCAIIGPAGGTSFTTDIYNNSHSTINQSFTNSTFQLQKVAYKITGYTLTEDGKLGCPGIPWNAELNVEPDLQLDFSPNQTKCSGDIAMIFVSTPYMKPQKVRYTWRVVSTGGITGAIDGPINPVDYLKIGQPVTQVLINNTPFAQKVVYEFKGYIITNNGMFCMSGPLFIKEVWVNPSAQVNIPPNQVVCNGFMTTPINFTTVNPVGMTNYSWNYSGPFIGLPYNGVGNIPSFNAINPGALPITATINVTPTLINGATCNGPSSLFTITVKPSPAISSINYTVCSGSMFSIIPTNGSNGFVPAGTIYSWALPVMTGGMTGGIPGGGMPSISGTLINPTNSPQTATYTVTPMAAGCTGPTFNMVVTVLPKPIIPNLTSNICSGTTFSVTPANGSNGVVPILTLYSWPAPVVTGGLTGGLASVGMPSISGTLLNTTNSPQTAIYSVTPIAAGCTGQTFNVAVTVLPKPMITNMTSTICSGTTFTVAPANGSNGIVPTPTFFSWPAPIVTGGITGGAANPNSPSIIGTLSNPTNSVQTATYTVTPIYNSCSGTPFIVTVTVSPTAQVMLSTTNQTICNDGTTNIILNSPSIFESGAITFNYTVVATGGVTGFTTPVTGLPNNYVIADNLHNPSDSPQTLTYTIVPISPTGCSSGPGKIVVITVNPTPQVVPGTLTQTICNNGIINVPLGSPNTFTSGVITFNYTIVTTGAVTGFTTPVFGLPKDHVIADVLHNPSDAPQIVTYRVTPISPVGCAAGPMKVIVITVNPMPVLTSVQTPSPICSNSVFSYTPASNIAGTLFNWTRTSVAGITPLGPVSGSGSINEMLTNTINTPITVRYGYILSANGCSNPSVFYVDVIVYPKPAVVITNPLAICLPGSTDLTATAVTAGSSAGLVFTYWTDAAATIPHATPATASPGTYYIKGTALSGCFDIKPVTVTGNPKPAANAGGSQTICSGGSATVTGASASFGNILWTSNGAGTLSSPTTLTPTYFATIPDAGRSVTLTMIVTSNNTCFPQTASATYSVNVKENQTIIFDPLPDRVYGDSPFLLTAHTSSLLDVTYTSSNTSVATVSGNTLNVIGAGITTIFANQPGDASHCAAPVVSQVLKVSAKPIIVKANPLQSKIFGDIDPVFTFSVSPSMFGADGFTGSLSRTPGESIGNSYVITRSTLDAGSNYIITYVPDYFTITAGIITVTVDKFQSKVYGRPDPLLTYTVDPASFPLGSLTGSLSRSPGEDAGSSYLISQGTLSSAQNNIVFISGNFTITPKPVTVTANSSQSKVYGEADPVLSFTVSPSLVGSDEFSGSLSRVTGDNAGNFYPITLGTLNAGVNYTITLVSANFSISPKPITASIIPSQSKFYGDTDPVFQYSFVPEMIGLDGFTGKPERTPGENVGVSYKISQGTLSAGTNYKIIFVTGYFKINPKQIELRVTRNQNKVYGSQDPKLLYSYSPELIGNDVITGSLTRLPGENPGSYPVQLGTVVLGRNYTIIFVPANFTVNKAPLTITADSKERHYLEENPEFSLSFSGFVNGENKSVLDVLPTATSNANSKYDAGTYDIEVSGGSDNNYLYIYKSGILTVLKADQFITFNEIPDKLRISQTFELVASASSGLPVSFESSDLKKAVISENIMLVNKEGRNTITAKQEGNINWNPAPDVSNSYIGQPSFDSITSLFTPNEDGVNDYWYIPDIEDFGRVQVKVYNRFGKLVYESSDYKNDWNGTFNGSPLPSASYYYIIKSSEKGVINGVVNIVR